MSATGDRAGAHVLAADRVVTGEAVHAPGWVGVADGLVLGVGAGRPERVDRDLGDAVIVPGFVDLHVHGGGGGSFTDSSVESALTSVATHRRHGTTTSMASLVTDSPDALLRSVGQLADLCADGLIAGIHLEGPWLSPARCGAHDPALLRDPDPAEIAALLAAARGAIAMVTLAPELSGAERAVRQIVDGGALAAVGHTDATYEQTLAALDAGARVGTHLFNAMRPIHHRQPGPIVALLDDDRVHLELIADGTHLHPAVYEHVERSTPAGRIVLVTDAMAAAGLGDGRYRLGGLQVDVSHGVARLHDGDTIAGSTATMDAIFRRAATAGTAGEVGTAGAPSDERLLRAVRQTAGNPAAALGRSDIGSLAAGKRADLVVLGPDLVVRDVLKDGRSVVTPD